jgi:hypothetical protein
MNSHILSKFAIIAATIAVNGLMFAGVNYLFNSQMQQRTDWVSRAQADGTGKTADHAVALVARRGFRD